MHSGLQGLFSGPHECFNRMPALPGSRTWLSLAAVAAFMLRGCALDDEDLAGPRRQGRPHRSRHTMRRNWRGRGLSRSASPTDLQEELRDPVLVEAYNEAFDRCRDQVGLPPVDETPVDLSTLYDEVVAAKACWRVWAIASATPRAGRSGSSPTTGGRGCRTGTWRSSPRKSGTASTTCVHNLAGKGKGNPVQVTAQAGLRGRGSRSASPGTEG